MSVVSTANNSLAIRIENLSRHYRMGEALIRAVDGIESTTTCVTFPEAV